MSPRRSCCGVRLACFEGGPVGKRRRVTISYANDFKTAVMVRVVSSLERQLTTVCYGPRMDDFRVDAPAFVSRYNYLPSVSAASLKVSSRDGSPSLPWRRFSSASVGFPPSRAIAFSCCSGTALEALSACVCRASDC